MGISIKSSRHFRPTRHITEQGRFGGVRLAHAPIFAETGAYPLFLQRQAHAPYFCRDRVSGYVLSAQMPPLFLDLKSFCAPPPPIESSWIYPCEMISLQA